MAAMNIFEKKRRVCYAETGVSGLIKPVTALNFFQDIMSQHCALMHASAYDLYKKGFAWVVVKYHLDIYRYPSWNDALLVRTWRFPSKNLYELRQFEVYNETQQLMISAKSCCVVISLETKKPVRLSKSLPENMIKGNQHPVSDEFDPIPDTADVDMERRFNIRMHDLDFNTHVNNSIYIVWALETVPEEIIMKCRPSAVSIHYMGESLYGDQIVSRSQRVKANPSVEFLHSLWSNNTQKEITRLKSAWEPFPRLA
jgi:medium-chain acyl-[acyl-carrier-protein] hydrolase